MEKTVPIRKMLNKEVYLYHEPWWSSIRMDYGWEPLPPTWEGFCDKMGWDHGEDCAQGD